MKMTPVPISGTFFFWAGFVCSISFLEAWLKFRAPGVTLPVGLSIGKLVFTALNRMEWVFVLFLAVWAFPLAKKVTTKFISFSGTVVLILIIQTFLLLPELNKRAEVIIAGGTPGESSAHILFGAAEIIKVLLLIYLGFYSARYFRNNNGQDGKHIQV